MFWQIIQSWPSITVAILVMYWIAVTVVVITDEREPTETLAWLLVLFAFPGVGLLFYFLFGRNWKKIAQRSAWMKDIFALARPTMDRVWGQYSATENALLEWAEPRGYAPIIKTALAADTTHVMPAYDVTILKDGKALYDTLKTDLRNAKDTINFQVFIWERDKLTAELTAILSERAQAGVEVRLLTDYVGCMAYKKDEIKQMQAAGVKFHADLPDWRKINYMDHRKIIVIDSVIGYVGGLNVGQEYIDGQPHYQSWRDTHSKFHGPAVADLQKLFAARWHENSKESLFNERFFPKEYPSDGVMVPAITVAQAVELLWDPARRVHEAAMAAARERIWIQSPYFIPTPDIYEIMVNQALAGKDVRLMITGVPDKNLPWRAAHSFFHKFLLAGGKIYMYEPGFFHGKTITIDGEMCAIGTMNMDIRSLALHKEVMTWYFSKDIATQHDAIFEEDMSKSSQVTLETVANWPASFKLRNSVSRLMSNLM
ncbi:MAG: cardiolipin synthase [Coriobacteriia bacterium]|nr:cardiolipin synthase [Coriobacteriia bacterium]